MRNTFVNAQIILTSEPTLENEEDENGVAVIRLDTSNSNQRIHWSNVNLIQASEEIVVNKGKPKHRQSFSGKSILKKKVILPKLST